MTADQATTERLTAERPEGTVPLDGALLAELATTIEGLREQDPAVAAAIEEGDAFTAAIDAGCPPQFHPGVPDEPAAVLATVRARLGLDRAEAIAPTADADGRHVRLLRAVGLEVAPAGSGG